jgi:hypothetical protein
MEKDNYWLKLNILINYIHILIRCKLIKNKQKNYSKNKQKIK